jgi:hypothetical protein
LLPNHGAIAGSSSTSIGIVDDGFHAITDLDLLLRNPGIESLTRISSHSVTRAFV